ncbi:MAG TPA: tail fiber domain-containing protein [Candidatus Acidoferrum sp.]|nr:tail fiber domain-containing protein [Candidatus Acidoferrum sp.]
MALLLPEGTVNMQTFINNFRTTIAATFGASDTMLQLLSSTGLPDLGVGEWYLLTLFRLDGVEESGHEVVKVTARTGNQLTVVRGWEGAAPSQFLTGDIVAARITTTSLNGKADLGWVTTQLAGKEPTIAAGTTGQYWRGDKSWATLNKAAVDLSAVDNTADVDKPVSTAQAAADTTVLNSAKAYAEGLVVGLYDDRGNYNASGNVFPSSGGSGPGGAIMKGDIWRISVAGNLGGTDVAVDQQIRALVDSPAQTSSNWGISGANFTITQSVTNGATGVVPSSDAVFDALAVKANSNNAALTGTTSVENLSFSGSTRRISGDFSHATHSNRVLFQTSTANSATTVGIVPSGSATTSNLNTYNAADPTNAAGLQMSAGNTLASLSAFVTGSGTALPLVFNTGGTERARFDAANYNTALLGGALEDNGAAYRTLSLGSGTTGSAGTLLTFKDSSNAARGQIASNTTAGLQLTSVGSLPLLFYTNTAERMRLSGSSNRLQADWSNATVGSRLCLQSSTANGNTMVTAVPNGTANWSEFAAYNTADPTNSTFLRAGMNGGSGFLYVEKSGTGSYMPLTFGTSSLEAMRIDTAGNIMFGITTTGDPIGLRTNGTIVNQSTKAIYSRSTTGWELGLNASTGTNISFYTDNGSAYVNAGTISSNGSTTSFNTSSDYRLKNDVQPMTGALDFIKQVQFSTWSWKVNGLQGEGVIAHQLQEISSPIPDAVWGEKDAIDEDGDLLPQCVDYSKLVPRIGCSVQELAALLDAAVQRIAALEAKIGGAA